MNDMQAEKETMQAHEQNDQSQEQLKQCQVQLTEWKDRCMRVTADLENFRRRMAREQESWTESAQAQILGQLLPIVDNFDRAFSQPKTAQDTQALLAGFELIKTSLAKLLAQYGVERMNNYDQFDPQFHEALTQVAVADKESGQIVEVLEQGYLFRGKVLRPARVSVAQ